MSLFTKRRRRLSAHGTSKLQWARNGPRYSRGTMMIRGRTKGKRNNLNHEDGNAMRSLKS